MARRRRPRSPLGTAGKGGDGHRQRQLRLATRDGGLTRPRRGRPRTSIGDPDMAEAATGEAVNTKLPSTLAPADRPGRRAWGAHRPTGGQHVRPKPCRPSSSRRPTLDRRDPGRRPSKLRGPRARRHAKTHSGCYRGERTAARHSAATNPAAGGGERPRGVPGPEAAVLTAVPVSAQPPKVRPGARPIRRRQDTPCRRHVLREDRSSWKAVDAEPSGQAPRTRSGAPSRLT